MWSVDEQSQGALIGSHPGLWNDCCVHRVIIAGIVSRGRVSLYSISILKPGVNSYSLSSTIKVFPSICAILFSIAYRPSPVACITNVRSFCGGEGGGMVCCCRAFKAPSISSNAFFTGTNSSAVFSAAYLVALAIGWKRVCSSSPIASFISRFTILPRRTVSIAFTYSSTRAVRFAGSLETTCCCYCCSCQLI